MKIVGTEGYDLIVTNVMLPEHRFHGIAQRLFIGKKAVEHCSEWFDSS